MHRGDACNGVFSYKGCPSQTERHFRFSILFSGTGGRPVLLTCEHISYKFVSHSDESPFKEDCFVCCERSLPVTT